MIEFNNRAHGAAIAKRIGCAYNQNSDPVVSRVTPQGNLLGGVFYQGYNGAVIWPHIAGFAPGWLSKDLLWVIFDYPFNQLKCNVLLAGIPVSNRKLLQFDAKLGFKEIVRVPGGHKTGDLAIMAMQRADCRWLSLQPKSLRSGGSS